MPNKFISFGEFSQLRRESGDRAISEQERLFVPDHSWLADGPGALSMQLRVGKYLFYFKS